MKTSTIRSHAMMRTTAIIVVVGSAISVSALRCLAEPVLGSIVSGSVSVSQANTTTTVNASDQSIIDWQTFDVGVLETVNFIQPTAQSVVLNRVTGGFGPSQINGTITANGSLLFVNPAGFVFGANSIVSADSFLAAAADLNNDFFNVLANQMTGIAGAITNNGAITANNVTLIAERLANHGQIVADYGLITLYTATGPMITESRSRIYVDLTPVSSTQLGAGGTPNQTTTGAHTGLSPLGAGDTYSLAVVNTGLISARGGIVNAIVNNGGFRNEGSITTSVSEGRAGAVNIVARDIANHGSITADSDYGRGGDINLSSTLDITLGCNSLLSAAGANGVANGGKVFLLSGRDIEMFTKATIDVSGATNGGNGGLVVLNAKGNADIAGLINVSAGMDSLGYTETQYRDGQVLLFESAPGVDDNFLGAQCDTTTPRDDSNVIAGSNPGEIPFTDSVKLDLYDLQILQRLAILANPPQQQEVVASLRGNARFNDMPNDKAANNQSRTTNAQRLNARAAQDAVELYNSIFGAPGQEQFDALASALSDTFLRYARAMSANTDLESNTQAFKRWIFENPDEQTTQQLLTSIGELLSRVRGIGLSDQEYTQMEQRILHAIAPEGQFHTDMLLELVRQNDSMNS
jgi:filamentous hemagglutinin family protein